MSNKASPVNVAMNRQNMRIHVDADTSTRPRRSALLVQASLNTHMIMT